MANKKPPENFTIKETNEGQRIDNFLFFLIRGVPKSRVYRGLRKGEIRVNGKRAKPSYKVQLGDVLRIPPFKTASHGDDKESHHYPAPLVTMLKKRIIYEDEQMMILNKPSGLAVHGGSGVSFGIIDVLRRHYLGSLELVHRLDRETSGCLLLAKNKAVLKALQRLIVNRAIKKHYLALLKGRLKKVSYQVDAPLRKHQMEGGERLVKVDTLVGKPAFTLFELILRKGDMSLAKIQIETGRTHQIRVHAQSIGHPIVGDEKYGDKSLNRDVRKKGLKRLFLHAASLEFKLEGKVIGVCACLDEDLMSFIK